MSERNEEGYQTLGWIINQSENGLFLVIAEESIQQEIVEVYRGGRIGVYDYKRYHGEYSFPALKDWIDTQADIRTFFIVNFQFAIPGQQDISRLNFSRDMLAGLGKNLVFFTTAYGDDQLAKCAYDFYSFLKIRITFHDYKTDVKNGNMTLMSEVEAEQREEMQKGEGLHGEDAKCRLREAYSLLQQAEEYNDKADYQESVRLLLKVRNIYEEVLGTEHLETASVYCDLAVVYGEMYAYQQAEKVCAMALEIRRKILGENHPDIAACYNILSQIYKRQGEIYGSGRMVSKSHFHVRGYAGRRTSGDDRVSE